MGRRAPGRRQGEKTSGEGRAKAKQMERCAQTELQRVSLAGNILQFYNALYTVCTNAETL